VGGTLPSHSGVHTEWQQTNLSYSWGCLILRTQREDSHSSSGKQMSTVCCTIQSQLCLQVSLLRLMGQFHYKVSFNKPTYAYKQTKKLALHKCMVLAQKQTRGPME
jgi:hypothetical protein